MRNSSGATDFLARLRAQEDAVANEEANYFAAMLLMPRGLFEEAIAGVDLLDDVALKRVAQLFQVSVSMVLYRTKFSNSNARS